MEQPNQYNGNQTNGKQKQATECSTSISMLNDDCLLHLCQYLSLWDTIRFGQTCERLKSFVGNNIYLKYPSLDWNNFLKSQRCGKISQVEVDDIFENMGPYIKQFKASCYPVSMIHDNFFSTIHKNLKNLQELHLFFLDLYEDPFEECYVIFNQLKKLELRGCRGLREDFFQFIPNVTHLSLKGIDELVGDGLSHLKHLQQLEIKDCVNMIPENLLVCLKENLQIVQLTLHGISLSQCSGFETIISNLKSLELLSLSHSKCWPFEKLDSLKSLHVYGYDVPPLKKLAAKGQLEELYLTMCKTFADTDADLQLYLLSFKKLKIVTFYGTWFTEEFLLRLTKELDFKSLTLYAIKLTDTAIVQLVKHSQNLEFLCYRQVTVKAIKEIIKLVNEDPHRPKLVFAVGWKKKNRPLCGTHDRVEITKESPNDSPY